MSENTKIEWTDATVNFWWGCTKVSPGCDHCYAENIDKRFGGAHWGAGAPRKLIDGACWTLHRLNNTEKGRRVFIQSMSDFFDNEVPDAWRADAWNTMCGCPTLDIQLLTKRIGNVDAMIPGSWPRHIGLMITVCDQAEADRDIPKLLALAVKRNIPWIGLSCEPMLGPIDLTAHFLNQFGLIETPKWVIVGGESGPGARPMNPDWARSVRDQCDAACVPFFFKQWGEYDEYGYRAGKARAGRLLDGRTHDDMPGVTR